MTRRAETGFSMHPRRVVFILPVVMVVLAIGSSAWAVCEFCGKADGGTDPYGGAGITRPCYEPEVGDLCNDPPPPCKDEEIPPFTLTWDEAGKDPVPVDDDQAQVWVTNDRAQACVYIQGVTKTGYYRLFDDPLAESCMSQQDETAYVSVTNTCNANGWAVEANVKNRLVVMDVDNTLPCEEGDCDDGFTCRLGNAHSKCCVPDRKAFLGTFLLVAGEPNKLCLNHWCPEWLAAKGGGEDLGFVTNECESANSTHLFLSDGFVGCEDDTMLKPCNWGCEDGQCLPDPCKAANCPDYCKDGECLNTNPCAGLDCKHGCSNGRCLQPPSAPGPDKDGDKYSFAADCDDDDENVNPGKAEVCGNGIDDNCDGQRDEGCFNGDGGVGARDGSAGNDDGGTDGAGGEGCGCAVRQDPPLWPFALVIAAVPFWWLRRRR